MKPSQAAEEMLYHKSKSYIDVGRWLTLQYQYATTSIDIGANENAKMWLKKLTTSLEELQQQRQKQQQQSNNSSGGAEEEASLNGKMKEMKVRSDGNSNNAAASSTADLSEHWKQIQLKAQKQLAILCNETGDTV